MKKQNKKKLQLGKLKVSNLTKSNMEVIKGGVGIITSGINSCWCSEFRTCDCV